MAFALGEIVSRFCLKGNGAAEKNWNLLGYAVKFTEQGEVRLEVEYLAKREGAWQPLRGDDAGRPLGWVGPERGSGQGARRDGVEIH